LFKEGIAPAWEDPKNKGGKTLSLEYEIKEKDDIQSFLVNLEKSWIQLMIMLFGETIPSSEYVKNCN
jgi:hypothetical protein